MSEALQKIEPVVNGERDGISCVEEIVADMRAGKPVIIVDDEDRENEGDLIVAAEMASGSSAPSLLPDYRPQAQPQRLYPEPLMTLGARGVIKFKEWQAGKEL